MTASLGQCNPQVVPVAFYNVEKPSKLQLMHVAMQLLQRDDAQKAQAASKYLAVGRMVSGANSPLFGRW